MFKKILVTTFRRMMKHKSFITINVLSLTIGLAVFSLIMIYVQYELAADKYNLNYDRIYRVDLDERFGVSSITIKQDVLDKFEEVVAGTRYFPRFVDVGFNSNFVRTNVTFVDPEFIDIFTLKQVSGNLKEALQKPNAAIISTVWAKKIFGDDDPIGKTIRYDRALDFTIEAVYEAPRDRTQLHIQEIIAPIINLKDYGLDFEDVWWANYITFFLLPPDQDNSGLIARINEHFQQLKEEIHPEYPDYHLRPFSEIYFDASKFDYSLHGNKSTVNIFFTSALFIIILAAINFINLSTSRASLWAKEVAIRKIAGANRRHLFIQFLLESLLLCSLAIIFSLILIAIFYPQFSDFFNIRVQFFVPIRIIYFVCTGLLLGVISGLYPAGYLSGFMPVRALSGKINQGMRSKNFRSILTVLQFAVSISLIICTLIVKDQLDYFQTKDLGFDKEQIFTFNLNQQIREHRDAFKQTLLQNPNILDACYIYYPLGKIIVSGWFTDENDEKKDYRLINTEPDFMDVHGIELVEGRNFDSKLETDMEKILINQTFVKEHGLENPLEFEIWGDSRVIGVVRDFNYRPLQYRIEPVIIRWNEEDTHAMSIRINLENTSAAVDHIKKTFEEFCPDIELSYNFNDDLFNKFYRAEKRFSLIFRYFSGLAILIACLGLFGLVSFLTTNRTKEIGIRKVLGASVFNIMRLLTKEITFLVIIANLIAWPISYYVMQKWMMNFAFQVEISIWNYLLASVLALFIAWLTVAFQTTKAAISNPVDALKYE